MSNTQAETQFTTTNFGVTTHSAETVCRDGMAMLEACGGNFTVEKKQVLVEMPTGESGVNNDGDIVPLTKPQPVKDCFLPARSDTGETIGKVILGEGYTVVDNADLVAIADAVCQGVNIDYRYMTVLNSGAGLVIQFNSPELNKALDIGNDDGSEGLLTLMNSHDGKSSLTMHGTIKRLFCSNVVPALRSEHRAKKGHLATHKVRHSKNMETNINQMIIEVRNTMDDIKATADTFRLLANKSCTANEEAELFKRLLNPTGADESELSKRAATIRENKLGTIKAARANPVNQVAGAGGSWYEVFQAISYVGTHGARTRDTGIRSEAETKWQTANIGGGSKFTAEGLELVMEMAGV